MAISVQCEVCGKQYDIPDDYSGRKGRCGGCGAVLVIGGAAQNPVVATAVADPRAGTGQPVELERFIPLAPEFEEPKRNPNRPPSSPSSPSNRSDTGRYVPKVVVAPPSIITDADALPAPNPGRFRQPGEPFRFYKAYLLDRHLPLASLLIYATAAILVALTRSWYVVLGFVLLLSLALPLARLGAGLGSRLVGYPMPDRPMARILAIMCMPILLNYALRPLLPGLLGHLLGGWLVGLFPAYFAFWFLYRTRWDQAVGGLLVTLGAVLPVVSGAFYVASLILAASGHPWR